MNFIIIIIMTTVEEDISILKEENRQLKAENRKLKDDIQRHEDLINVLIKSVKKLAGNNEVFDFGSPFKIIQRELLQYQDDDSLYFTIDKEDDELKKLRVTLSPPDDCPYSEGIFFLSLWVPSKYPAVPPAIQFETKIYHPNVNEFGMIDWETFQQSWIPSYSLKTAIEYIHNLLSHPQWGRGMMAAIESQYQNNPNDYIQTAREWTQMYAV